MKISEIETIPVRIPLKPERRMKSALGSHEVSEFVLVRLTTDSGVVGCGEATATPRWSGETVRGVQAMIDDVLAPAVIGCDVSDIDQIDRRMEGVTVYNWFARSAIEMACWDAVGKAQDQPVYELLGGPTRDLTIRNRFSLGAYPPEIAAERAAERVAAGFQTIKVKVGTGNETDIARVKAVREAIGADIEMTIDANGGWSDEDARYCLPRLEEFDIRLVEQPLPRGNYRQLKALRSDLGIRVLADESCFDMEELLELVHQDCCDAITLYPGKQGGIQRAVRMAAVAAEYGIPCTIGSNLEWDPGAAAMMHFIVAAPNVCLEEIPGDCLGPSYHEFSIVTDPLQIEGPFTTLTDRAGLGVEVDWEKVEQCRLP